MHKIKTLTRCTFSATNAQKEVGEGANHFQAEVWCKRLNFEKKFLKKRKKVGKMKGEKIV